MCTLAYENNVLPKEKAESKNNLELLFNIQQYENIIRSSFNSLT